MKTKYPRTKNTTMDTENANPLTHKAIPDALKIAYSQQHTSILIVIATFINQILNP
jgi:hypothetical protein